MVAFNAQGGARIGRIIDRLRRPPLSGAGIILLSEAGWRMRISAGHEVAREIASALGLSFVFSPEFAVPPIRPHGATAMIGNAILSAEPLDKLTTTPITRFTRRKTSRLVGTPVGLSAAAIFGGAPLTIGVAHLDSRVSPKGRERQMAAFARALPAAGPAIVGGDFNTTTIELIGRRAMLALIRHHLLSPRRIRSPENYEPLFERLFERGFSLEGANVPGAPTFTPSRVVPPLVRPKLDWIAVRELKPITGSAKVVAARDSFLSMRFSDHDFIVCELRGPA
ncbi:MAG: endonuclease/exonuclease/phosphatase family protein [Candidatus Binataceae bacterium]